MQRPLVQAALHEGRQSKYPSAMGQGPNSSGQSGTKGTTQNSPTMGTTPNSPTRSELIPPLQHHGNQSQQSNDGNHREQSGTMGTSLTVQRHGNPVRMDQHNGNHPEQSGTQDSAQHLPSSTPRTRGAYFCRVKPGGPSLAL